MEPHLLKRKILDHIEDKTVVAALFYTFNFEPVFFETYVLPLLMPQRARFKDNNPVTNQFLWRELRQDMPKVMVYCDDYAKSKQDAPTLDYTMCCIRVPCAKGAITNFHLKHIFLLLEAADKSKTVLFINGSGNLTPAGWCRNIESFSIEICKPSVHTSVENSLCELIKNVAQMHHDSQKSFAPNSPKAIPEMNAEKLIYDFLQTCNLDHLKYFNSFKIDFQSFIKKNILESENLNALQAIEIISPYFSKTDQLLDFLQTHTHTKAKVKIQFLLPLIHNEINLEEATFELLSEQGGAWHDWEPKLKKALNENNSEDRFTHAKIYRFIFKKKTYTIIGSVNFTIPAWSRYTSTDNKANIEAALLYEDKNSISWLDNKVVNTKNKSFVSKPDLEAHQTDVPVKAFRNAPNVVFTIDWMQKKLKYKFFNERVVLKDKKYRFDGKELDPNKYVLDLDAKVFKKLIKNSLIELQEQDGTKTISYYYYPNHENFVKKPLAQSLSSDEIIHIWQHLDDKVKSLSKIVNAINDRTDEESGEIASKPLIFNRWGLEFSGLVALEKMLFGEKSDPSKIEYYLTHRSYDTVLTYLDAWQQEYDQQKHNEQKHGKKTVYDNFYWMILQIISQNFYQNSKIRPELHRSLAEQRKDLERQLKKVEGQLPDFKTHELKYEFLKEQLKLNY